MKHRAIVLFSLISTVALASAQAGPGSMNSIRTDFMKAHLEFLSHDLLEGRDTPSRGLDIANLYLATQLKLYGVQPAGVGDTFYQPVPLVVRKVDATESKLTIGDNVFPYGKFLAPTTPVQIGGSVVFVGHGYRSRELGIDPYANITARGKILLVLDRRPRNITQEMLRAGAAQSPEQMAGALGAQSVVRITDLAAAAWSRSVESTENQGRVRPSWTPSRDQIRGSLVLGREATAALFENESVTLDDVYAGKAGSLELKKPLGIATRMTDQPAPASNVVAIVPGSDPTLSKEVVAVCAHIDHLGMRDVPIGQDGIFNGADDNGSGTVSALELARVFASGARPKRSVLFIWHVGEEKGLWGSEYFVNNPTIPLESITGLINIDMIARSKAPGDTSARNARLTGPNGIHAIGSRKVSSEFGDILADVNRRLFNMTFDYSYDDPRDPENLYQRSDHYNFALKGIPVVFYFDGIHEDYHQVSDHVEKIDFGKLERVTKTIYAQVWELANRETRPKPNP